MDGLFNICDQNDSRVYAKIWKNNYGQKYVDIRTYWIPRGESTYKPTKEGVCFRMDQWEDFNRRLSNISLALEKKQEYSFQLDDSQISIQVKMVQGIQSVVIKCDRKENNIIKVFGVTLSQENFKSLLDKIPLLNMDIVYNK